jgi:hypothetical protein
MLIHDPLTVNLNSHASKFSCNSVTSTVEHPLGDKSDTRMVFTNAYSRRRNVTMRNFLTFSRDMLGPSLSRSGAAVLRIAPGAPAFLYSYRSALRGSIFIARRAGM